MKYLLLLYCCVFLFSCKKEISDVPQYDSTYKETQFTGIVYRKGIPEIDCSIFNGKNLSAKLGQTNSSGYFDIKIQYDLRYSYSGSPNYFIGISSDGMYSFTGLHSTTSQFNGRYDLKHLPVYIIEVQDTSVNSDTISISVVDPMSSIYFPDLFPQLNMTRTAGDTSINFISGSTTCQIKKNGVWSNYSCNDNDTLQIHINY